MKKKKVEKCFVIRAYCSDCGKMLMESAHMTKRELMVNWDQAVIDAAGIVCADCAPRRCPNFHIDLKILHLGTGVEYAPDQLLPKPEKELDLGLPDYLQAGLEKASK